MKRQKETGALTCWLAFCLVCVLGVTGMLMVRHSYANGDIERAYLKTVKSMEQSGEYSWFDELRFALGYIDDDDIPELLLSFGNGHVDPIYVCAYDSKTKTADVLGAFSSFGDLYYYEKQRVTVSQYGGSGFWYHIYEEVSGQGIGEILALSGSYAAEEETIYYWKSPFEAAREELWDEFDFNLISVSEEEYIREVREFRANYTDEIHVSYSNMTDFSADNLRAAFGS